MTKATFTLRTLRTLSLAFILSLSLTTAHAQVTGIKTIGVDYVTIAAAIADLNTNGISGPVVVNVPAGYTETAPAGGYLLGSTVLNASTSSSSTLTFQKSGSGADPLLTAFIGTSLATDGIFIIQGTDYVTINAIDVTESVSNVTPTTQMEWGYALVKLQNVAPFDGCQNVTIENCVVTLNRTNTATVGIYANNHIATATTFLTITSTSDAMNNCTFSGDTIQNCVTGISLRGFSAAPSPYTLYDQGNTIGGSSTTGNIIRNYAGTTTGAGVNLQYQNSGTVSYNNINNTDGSGIAATSILYGVYTQNGTNTSVTVTNNTIALTEGTTSSALYGVYTGSGGTGTVTVSDNTLTANGGSTGSMYMIYFGSGNLNINTSNNDFYNINVATSGSLYMVYHSTAASTTNITCNNNFTSGPATPYVHKTGSGGTVACYYNNAGASAGVVSYMNNNFSNFNLAGSPTFYGLFENDGGTGQNKMAYNNVISNITTTGGTIYGLYMGFSASESFAGNHVSNLNAGTGTIYGIYVNGSSTLDSVINNNINNLSTTGANIYGVYISGGTTVNVYLDTISTLAANTLTTGLAYGIYQSSGTTVNIFRNKIYDISASGTGSSVNGMYLNSGTVTAYNNLVGDLRTPNLNTTTGTQLVGMYLGAGSTYNIYYNTVYLNAISAGTNFGSCGIYSSTTPAVTLRNNIIDNTSTPNGTGITVAYRRGSTTLTTYQAASNNNLFYAGTPGTSNVIYYDGTATYTTLAAFKALVTPRDVNSVTENPPFVSTAGSSASFLHISTTTPTQIESGAINIAGITTDADGNIRAGNAGYSGTGSAPDIGAEEGNYILTDLSAPAITFTALSGGCSTGDRTFTAAITDATGVPVTGTLVPRVYFKKGSGSWFSAAGSLTSGTSTSGVWTFTISAATMGGLVVGDVVSYFVIAQDLATTPNIGSNPATGLVATDVNTISSYPTTPDTYTILPVLSGTYNVGAGMAYTTITDAINAYNTSCISGSVIFQLTDATYSGETFPITINANGSAGPTNTLIIRPAAGVSPSITGSSTTALFILNGADYVTIDGSNSSVTNSVCPLVTATRDMTISNTSTGTSSAVIWLQTATGADGATNNVIRNCNLAGSGNSFTLFGVGSGGTSIAYTSAGTGNSNNIIENNNITATQTGIFSMGASASNKNTGNIINQNLMNSASPNNQRNNGIIVGFENNITISGNNIANITNAISNDITGINLGYGNNAISTSITTGNEVTNATVTNNILNNITQTNTYSCVGIAVAGATSGTNLIANNMVSGVLSNGTGGDFSSGIFIGGATGGTTNVYYNSVNMSGTVSGASYPTFAISISGTNPVVNLKNNLFVNNAVTGSTLLYAIGLAYSTYSNLSSDYNDFYSVGSVLATVGSLSGSGTAETALADWQTATGGDAHSKNVNPVFTSPSDLHLTSVGPNVPLDNTGTPVSVTNDIDCNSRSSTPDMGINEFDIPTCSSVTSGAIALGTPAFCGSGTTTLSLPGATVGLGIDYQWESSTDSTTFTPIAGATRSSYTTAIITATTYYRVIVVCSFSGATDSASTRVIIHPLPIISVSPDGGPICSTGTGLTMTASGAATYSWLPTTGLSAISGPIVTADPSATTAYTVTGTDTNGCINTHLSTVTVSEPPAPITVTPSSASMCPGDAAVLLSVAGAITPSAGPDTFSSGAISVTIPDATPSGASNDIAVSGIPLGATITSVSVLFNITMTFDGDLTLNLTAPNGSTLNLVSREGGGGANFTNTLVSSSGGATFGSSTAPYTGTYNADAVLGAGTTSLPVTTGNWADLYSIANGTWTFSGRDWAGGDVATINSWTLIINYTYSPAVTWSPVTGLFTDAGATTAYTGAPDTVVYASPSSTTSYTATLTLGGCTTSATTIVSVNPLPVAGTISGRDSLCIGSTITLTDPASTGVWSVINTNASVSGTGVLTGVAAGADTVKYSVTNVCGTAVAEKAVTVDAFPVAGTISGASAVCVGSSVSLTSSAPGGVWSRSNASASVAGGLVTGNFAGVDTIIYSLSNSCGTARATHVVTVNPLPVAGTISGPVTVCVGSTIALTETASGGLWSAANANATVTDSGIVTGASGGADLISYAVTNVCGTAVATHAVTVNALPIIYSVSGGGVYCEGGTGVHVGLANSQTGVNYQLFDDGVASGSPLAGAGGTIDFGLETATGTYTVVATSVAGGCVSAMSGAAVVQTNPTTPPSVSIATDSGDTLCSGTLTIFTAIPVNGGLTPTYQWYVNGTASGTGNTYSYTPANGDVVTVHITSSSCAVPDTASSSITITIVSFLTPSVSITAVPGTTVCAGTIVTFTAATVNGGPSPFIRWTKNGINVATGPTYSYVPANGDIMYCTMKSSYPCVVIDSVFSNHITMNVAAEVLPTVAIHAHPGTIINIGESDTLTADVANGGPSPRYQWYINGIPVPGATTAFFISHTFVNGDNVSVTVTSSGACSGLVASAHVVLTVGNVNVGQVTSSSMDIRLFPNPNSGVFTIKGTLAGIEDQDVSLQITDLLGQEVYHDNVVAKQGKINEQIVLKNNMANGTYLLKLSSGDQSAIFHFVLEQ